MCNSVLALMIHSSLLNAKYGNNYFDSIVGTSLLTDSVLCLGNLANCEVQFWK